MSDATVAGEQADRGESGFLLITAFVVLVAHAFHPAWSGTSAASVVVVALGVMCVLGYRSWFQHLEAAFLTAESGIRGTDSGATTLALALSAVTGLLTEIAATGTWQVTPYALMGFGLSLAVLLTTTALWNHWLATLASPQGVAAVRARRRAVSQVLPRFASRSTPVPVAGRSGVRGRPLEELLGAGAEWSRDLLPQPAPALVRRQRSGTAGSPAPRPSPALASGARWHNWAGRSHRLRTAVGTFVPMARRQATRVGNGLGPVLVRARYRWTEDYRSR